MVHENENETEPLLIVISGPSGVGKDTVLNRLKERSQNFHFVITATTRKKRPNEVHGVDYFFVTEQEFLELIAKDELLEHALVYKDYKGVPKEQVRLAMASGKDVLMRVDVQGAATIRSLASEAILIFLKTATEEELAHRLEQRKTDSPEQLKVRIEAAKKEYQRIKEFDYQVINRDDGLDETVDTILTIIHAEHHRTEPKKVRL